jgi:carbon-monoxide dehydrogenase catalytic subunit
VIGSIETGQELLQRYPMDEVFVGLMGNWLAIEPMLAAGVVDVLAMEENALHQPLIAMPKNIR